MLWIQIACMRANDVVGSDALNLDICANGCTVMLLHNRCCMLYSG